jgi:BlaI family transcriptional regulator, penicillinase repressor
MKNAPRITDTEWEIMRVIWAQHPIAASEIIERLAAEDPSWHPKTARTLLARLVQKKALGYEAHGRAYVYEPLVTERQCVAAESESFLDRVFDGALTPMLAHFVRQKRLSKKELAELRTLLESQAESNKPGKPPGKS